METKKKWDLPTRILHWTIAISIISLALTALLGEAAEETLGKKAEISVFYIHLYIGFIAIAAVALRVIWGFFGNDAVNWRGIFSGLAAYPAAARAEFAYLISGKQVEGRSKSAHNPLAVPVYLGALIFFIVTAVTGLNLWSHLDEKAARNSMAVSAAPSFTAPAYADSFLDDEEKEKGGHEGHGAGKSEFVEEIHEFALFWVALYLLLHLGGIFIHYVREDKSVIQNMLNP